MQAIQTKYHGPTNTRGSRISARCDAGRISIPYPHELSGDACHIAAAQALCDKLTDANQKAYGTKHGYTRADDAWQMPRVCGGLPDGSCVHVFTA